jgi:YfiH family protein
VTEVERGGLRLLVFPRLEAEAGLVCAISTAPLDVGEPEDRDRLVRAVGLEPGRAATLRQVHRSTILEARDALGKEPPQADGLITDEPRRPLVLRAADCSLVVVADLEHRALGMAHAGWKGSARGVVVNLVKAMRSRFGTDPARCLAGVGPTIGSDRYEVGARVPAAFLSRRAWTREYVSTSAGKLYLDLAGVNARFLEECGIPAAAIDLCRICTYESEGLLHSFRRDGTRAGHHGLVAAVKGTPQPCHNA